MNMCLEKQRGYRSDFREKDRLKSTIACFTMNNCGVGQYAFVDLYEAFAMHCLRVFHLHGVSRPASIFTVQWVCIHSQVYETKTRWREEPWEIDHQWWQCNGVIDLLTRVSKMDIWSSSMAKTVELPGLLLELHTLLSFYFHFQF